MKHVSVVSPRPHPSPRRMAPKSSPVRKASAAEGSASVSVIVAFASTSGMFRSIVSRAQVDEDLVAAELHGKATQIVGPLVERPPRAEIEPRVVPVAGEDPVGDRPAVEREAHVRAAV